MINVKKSFEHHLYAFILNTMNPFGDWHKWGTVGNVIVTVKDRTNRITWPVMRVLAEEMMAEDQ